MAYRSDEAEAERGEIYVRPFNAATGLPGEGKWRVSKEGVRAMLHWRADGKEIIVLIIGTSRGLAWELGRVRDLEQLHKLIVVFPPTDDVVIRWKAVRDDDLATGRPMLPASVRPDRTLALIYADDLTPILIEGQNDEWSYETALRVGGILAITTGAEPASQVIGR